MCCIVETGLEVCKIFYNTCTPAYCCPSRSCIGGISRSIRSMTSEGVITTALVISTLAYIAVVTLAMHRHEFLPREQLFLASGVLILGGAALFRHQIYKLALAILTIPCCIYQCEKRSFNNIKEIYASSCRSTTD